MAKMAEGFFVRSFPEFQEKIDSGTIRLPVKLSVLDDDIPSHCIVFSAEKLEQDCALVLRWSGGKSVFVSSFLADVPIVDGGV